MTSKGFKILSLIVTVVMLISLFGCSPTPSPTSEATQVSAAEATATTVPAAAAATTAPAEATATSALAGPVDVSTLPKLSFSVMTTSFGVDPTGKEVQDLWLQKSSELMGKNLDIDFQYVNHMDYGEKVKVILASGELPDIITLNWLTQEEIVKYGDAGLFVDLSQYLDQMPNYKKLLEEAPSTKPNLFSKEGKLYGVYSGSTNNLGVDGGHDMNSVIGFRVDIFEKNKIAIPTTLDELTAAAQQLKMIYPDKYPIAPNSSWETPWYTLVSMNHCGGWDTYRYFDGVAWQYAALQECMKDMVATLNLWVEEKLIAPDYMSFTDAQGPAALAAGDAMILPGFWYGFPGYWETQYPDQKWAMVAGISNPKYGPPWTYGTYTKDSTSFITNYGIAISAKSEHVEELVKFLDLQLSKEISDLQNWGIEGKTFTVSDGVNSFTPEYIKAQAEADDPLNASNLCIGSGQCRPGIFPQLQDRLSGAEFSPLQDNIVDGELIRAKNETIKRDSFQQDQEIPKAILNPPLTTDESNEYANIMTPIETYAKSQVALFILGKRPMSEWDTFVDELKAMGDIQKALDIYNAHTQK